LLKKKAGAITLHGSFTHVRTNSTKCEKNWQ